MLENLVLILAVVVTSGVAWAMSRVRRRPAERSVLQAAAEVMECIGLCVTFLAVNVALGVAVILIVRTLMPVFVSLYAMDDLTLVALSAFQGIGFRFWLR
jgi:hypothetical protein